MSAYSEEHLHYVLSAVAKTCGIVEWKCEYRQFSRTGQNYFGTLIPVTLSGKQCDNDITIYMVLKLAPCDERYRVSGALTDFFRKEIFFYSTILKKYEEIQQKFPKSFVMPKCYYLANDYCSEVIAMEDMSLKYEPFDGTFMDLNHIITSMKSLARFHSLSFILKKQDLQLYEEVQKVCVPVTEKTNHRFMCILKDRIIKAIDKLQNTKYVPTLQHFKENYVNLVEAASSSVSQTCICHGDLWKENILFQYKGNQPKSACLIDYQTIRMCSPAFDVLFLIATSTDQHLRQKYLSYILDSYYFSLDEFLKFASIDSRKVYSRETLNKDLKIVAPACFIVANTALWLSNGLQQEGHVRSKNVFTTDEEKMEAVYKYKTVVQNILEDFSCSGYINLISS